MESLVDPTVLDAVLDAAGASSYRNVPDVTVFASAAGFCVGAESVRLSIFTPPTGTRATAGPARWVVVTDERMIMVTGEMPGDWWSTRSLHFTFSGKLTVSVRSLDSFKEFRFVGERWIWHPEAVDSAGEFLHGTTALLRPIDGAEDLILWEDLAVGGAISPKAVRLAEGLRWLATRVSIVGERA